MKTGILALLALLATLQVRAQGDRQLVIHLSQPGRTFTLNVNTGRTAISVSGYEGKDLLIQTNNPKVSAQEKNNEVTVAAPDPEQRPVRLTIKVPQTPGIFKLNSVNGGTIHVSDVTGNLELQNKSGGIVCEHISGSVVASTLSGRITVSFKSVDAGAAMAFSTVSGGIQLTFPATLKANLKIRSDHSKLYSNFELTGDPAHPQTLNREKNGFYPMPPNDWIYSRVGGGGPEMLIKNTTGNIYIYQTP